MDLFDFNLARRTVVRFLIIVVYFIFDEIENVQNEMFEKQCYLYIVQQYGFFFYPTPIS